MLSSAWDNPSVRVGCPMLSRSIGKEPNWVDLEADPPIDKEHPPDLKPVADALPIPSKVEGEGDAAAKTAGTAAPQQPAAAGVKVGKKGGKGKGAKEGGEEKKGAASQARLDDVELICEAIIGKVSGEGQDEAACFSGSVRFSWPCMHDP